MNYPRRFIFRGNASGLSAHIRRPEDLILPVQAASCLPVTGGISESKAGPHALGCYLNFMFAETTANGDFANKQQAIAITHKEMQPDEAPTRTTVTAAVRGLNVGKRFVAGLAQVNLFASNPLDGEKEPSIRIENGKLDGISIDGYPLEIAIDNDIFSRCDTFEKVRREYCEKHSDEHRSLFHWLRDKPSDELFVSGGIAYSTIVSGMKWTAGKPKGVEHTGPNSFYIENFGSVYFGEVLISAMYRRVTMIRLQLGSDVGGDVCAAEGETNGQHWPV